MLAGVGALGQQAFNLPFSVGVLIFAILCFVTFLFDLDGIVEINVVFAPLLVVGGIFFGIYSIATHYTSAFSTYLLPLEKWEEGWRFCRNNLRFL